METCPESTVLIQWLNGALPTPDTQQIEKHIESCDVCHEKLLNLTDDYLLQPPPNPDELLGDRNTYTNEPHFRSMRERVARSVARMKSESPDQEPESGNGNLKNIIDVSVSAEERETMDANVASTHNSGPGEQVLTKTVSANSVRINGFLLEAHIGSGGFAHVFRAWEKKLARPVAIKLLDENRINARNRHRFLREAKAASSVRSPHVVQVLTSGEAENGHPFIAMELVEGDTLAQWIADRSKSLDARSIEQGVKLLEQVCRGVQAVHDANLIHRDIKPGNIFVDSSSSTAKLGDFGLIRILDEDTVTLTRAAELAGTPAYMSPEQTMANSELDATSDVYGLGASLYQTLTGQSPFRGSSVSILKQVNESQPLPPRQLNEHVSKDLETICLKALEKEPRRRYQSAMAMAQDLSAAIDGRPIVARPISGFEKLLRWAKRNRALASVAALLVFSLAAGTISSTALWLNSAYHANVASDRFAALSKSESSLRESESMLKDREATLRKSQAEMRESVRRMVSNTFSKHSSYLGLSGPDRIVMMRQLGVTYRTIFDESPNDIDSVREIVADLARATEFGLELAMYTAVPDLVDNNRMFADRLAEFPDLNESDRALVALVYNQSGEIAQIQNDVESAAEFYLKAQSLTSENETGDNESFLQHLRATKSLFGLNQDDSESIAGLQTLLADISEIRGREPELPAAWMTEHASILKKLASLHNGKEKIAFRELRSGVYRSFIDDSAALGRETFWYQRNAIVNDTFTAIEYLKIRDVENAKIVLHDAIDRQKELLEVYPRIVQFRADLYEMLVIAGNIEWNPESPELAMEYWADALAEFEVSLKINAKDNLVRRRFAQVLQMVAERHAQVQAIDDSLACLEKAEIQMRVVIESPIEPERKEADIAVLEKIVQRREQLATTASSR